MSTQQFEFTVDTRDRGTYDLTAMLAERLAACAVDTGLCHVFVCHTSASLMLCENADPDVRRDLETLMSRMIPDGDPMFVHRNEGPDDMPAHARSVLTGSELTVPVRAGRLALGTWQGVYLWEHRSHGQRRRVIVTVLGG
ncbi:secondary thiamine-phosphate synthase enzyme YjbQ [Acidihalobacter prosperus]|uniref:Secondary thiamine-phosphate synthase n=1 Tax=Acidihalobacter prosperus TaxID=160660 RepID=A0A1A6C5C8_9GAMM|nr:secondary thiamine-phosphate synthase enzyme YjbQ [Acidihalobacter prosperus]OBS09776.1 secondary thiamine-phosphate synthase [Acidihalobacter prosperus]